MTVVQLTMIDQSESGTIKCVRYQPVLLDVLGPMLEGMTTPTHNIPLMQICKSIRLTKCQRLKSVASDEPISKMVETNPIVMVQKCVWLF